MKKEWLFNYYDSKKELSYNYFCVVYFFVLQLYGIIVKANEFGSNWNNMGKIFGEVFDYGTCRTLQNISSTRF